MKKNIIVIILTILVLGLSGYIVYDKVLNAEEENTNYQENDYNQTSDNIADIEKLIPTKTYAGCIKSEKLPKESDFDYAKEFEYAIYILDVKSNGKCTFTFGGINNPDLLGEFGGNTILPYDCDDAVFGLHWLSNLEIEVNEINYKPANVIMKKVDSIESVDYNFCKNNY